MNHFKYFLFVGTICLIGCNQQTPQPNSTTNNNNGGNTAPSSFYISFDLDGTPITYENGVDNYQLVFSNDSEVGTTEIQVSPGAGLYDAWNVNNDQGSVEFRNHLFSQNDYSGDKAAALSSIFTVGAHPYISDSDDVNEGVKVYFILAGDLWSSGGGTQPGSSSFEVTESTEHTNGIGEAQRDVKGNFSCTVFNLSGSSKSVTNGIFYLRFSAP